MQRKSALRLTALTLLGLLSACQATGSDLILGSGGPSANPTQSPDTYPVPVATYSPGQLDPTPTPTPTALPEVTPTPGSEPIESRTEADVVTRRESHRLERLWVSPGGTRMIYHYQRELEADLRDWVYNPAYRTANSGLWLQDASGRRPIQTGSISPWNELFWLDEQTIAWLSDSRDEIVSLNLETGVRSSFFKGGYLSGLSQRDGKLYLIQTLMQSQNRDARVVAISADGQSRSFALPHLDFYTYGTARIQALGNDQVLLSQDKGYNQSGQYPFKVMMTLPPPVVDTYLFSLADGQAEPVKGGLDLTGSAELSLSPDGAHYLVRQAWANGLRVYSRAGTELFQTEGRGIWLDAGRLLLLDPLGISIRSLTGETVYHASTQSSCSQAFAVDSQALIQCAVHSAGRTLTRVYTIAGPIPPGGPLRELALNLPAEGRAELTAEGLILAHVPGSEGYTAAYRMQAGQLRQLLKLDNPTAPQFRFDPKAENWARGPKP